MKKTPVTWRLRPLFFYFYWLPTKPLAGDHGTLGSEEPRLKTTVTDDGVREH